jgi:hypothetical protein
METIVRNIGELNAGDRSAIERLVGRPLSENQRLVIRVMNVDLAKEETGQHHRRIAAPVVPSVRGPVG